MGPTRGRRETHQGSHHITRMRRPRRGSLQRPSSSIPAASRQNWTARMSSRHRMASLTCRTRSSDDVHQPRRPRCMQRAPRRRIPCETVSTPAAPADPRLMRSAHRMASRVGNPATCHVRSHRVIGPRPERSAHSRRYGRMPIGCRSRCSPGRFTGSVPARRREREARPSAMQAAAALPRQHFLRLENRVNVHWSP